MASNTTRVVPLSGIMTEDSVRRPEFIACDLPNEEADQLIGLGSVVRVLKTEVAEGARVVITAPVVEAVPAPVPVAAPIVRIQLGEAGQAAKVVKEEDVPPEPVAAVVPTPIPLPAEAIDADPGKGKAKS